MKTTAEAMRMHNSLKAEQKKRDSSQIYTIEMWKEESTPPELLKRVGKKPKTEKCRVRKAKNGIRTQ